MPYLFEPYNAYQKPAKKKHWTQIAEEEALLIKMQLEEAIRQQSIEKTLYEQAMKEHLALREAAAKQNQQPNNWNNQNLALPQYFPQPAQQQVQDGQYAAPAGGGGWISQLTEELQEVTSFTVTPTFGLGPLAVTFVNNTVTPENDTFLWLFGSGSLTSTAINPTLTYTALGTYTVTLQETSSAGNTSISTQTITVNAPSVISTFTFTTSSNSHASIAMFSNASTTNGVGTLNYHWYFGSGSATSVLTNPTQSYTAAGTYTVQLQTTESIYGVANATTSTFTLS